MPKRKQKIKTKVNNKKSSSSKFLDDFNWFKNNKLVIASLIFILFFLSIILNVVYKNWDNAQLIKGLARDFPALVDEIEQATGLDLEIKSNCSTTTEKFSEGVKTCELSVAHPSSQETINKATNAILSSSVPSSVKLSETKRTYKITYRNKNSCQISNQDSVYLTCITAVRDANTGLAIEEFSNIQ